MKKFFSKWLAGMLAVALLFTIIPTSLFAATADLTITTYTDLQKFAESVNGGNSYEGKTVQLNVNISLGGKGNPWVPIGTATNPFKGTFDGNNHVISEIYIASGSSVGFFGEVNGGTVKNLVVSGSITGDGNVGGIVGKLTSGTVQNCGNNANINSGNSVGGIVGGFNGVCNVNECYNYGVIKGTTGYVGGVVGMGSASSKITNSYNAGEVSGPATVGGVAGGHKAYAMSLTNCYNSGVVTDTTGNKNNIGAVVGATRGTLTNCYYIKGTGENSKSGVTEVTSLEPSMLSDSYTNGKVYPTLKCEALVSTDTPVKPPFVEKTELSVQLAGFIKNAVLSAKAHAGINQSESLLGNDDFLSGVSSTNTDWMALAMGRFGYFDSKNSSYNYLIDDKDGYSKYLATMKTYIENTYKNNDGILHSVKATEWHRGAITISTLGGNPLSFGTYNDNPINLISDGSYSCVLRQGPGTQGINGWIWGLIALDTGVYDVPINAKYTREQFIKEILKLQLTDGVNGNEYGGWVLGGYGNNSDVDITAMAIQALAPYYNDETTYTYTNENSKKQLTKTVRQCVDEALDCLGAKFDSNAGFSSWSTNNVEGVSQVIVALTSIGIDPAKDTRFITEKGENLLDGLLKFKLSDGGFCHVINGGWNNMATDQAAYALASYWRLENGMRSLYDMRSDWTETEKTAISTAVSAINFLPEPTADNYKAELKTALKAFRSVKENERRYVGNYSKLAAAIALVGGESALDTNNAYITKISVTKNPNKINYYEGDMFDPNGMVVTATLSDGATKNISDYKFSPDSKLKLENNTIYITYGILKATIQITVQEKMPWAGEGTEINPYLIGTVEELQALAKKVNAGNSYKDTTFVMTNYIDLSTVTEWTPIGSGNTQFEGTFDGKGYVIDNLYSSIGGLFGKVGANAVIQNVGVASGEIGTTSGNKTFIGGIAGWSNGTDFINCWNGVEINCSGYSGGIVGTVRDGGKSSIIGCYNVGDIIGTDGQIGGIVGHLDTSRNGSYVEVTLKNCYNIGTIKGSYSIGGIAGKVQDGQIIQNCYNAGVIDIANKSEGGAVFGFITNDNQVENCYYNSESYPTGVADGIDNTIGKTTAELKSNDFLKLLGTSFKTDAYKLVNQGYPILSWQKTISADAIDDVILKIEQIGTVTLDSAEKINEARTAYDNLDEELKQFVSNASVLDEAEKKLADLQNQFNQNNKPTPSPSTAGNIPILPYVILFACTSFEGVAIIKRRKIHL